MSEFFKAYLAINDVKRKTELLKFVLYEQFGGENSKRIRMKQCIPFCVT